VKLAVMLGVVYAATSLPAEARCYSQWYYPYPQHCAAAHGVYARTARPRTAVLPIVYRPVTSVPDRVHEIPLPDMSATWGGAMDTELELALQRQKAIRQLTLGVNQAGVNK
jgi:hypothetical protein